jgi:aryl-alcohol dehydrogenase-like predicted oxidoreductase
MTNNTDDRTLREKIAADAAAFDADTGSDGSEYVPHHRAPRDPVYSLRLPAERIEQLRALADARGIDASALARQWIVEQLDTANRFRDRAAERWERDVRATTLNLQDQAEHLRHLLDERPSG